MFRCVFWKRVNTPAKEIYSAVLTREETLPFMPQRGTEVSFAPLDEQPQPASHERIQNVVWHHATAQYFAELPGIVDTQAQTMAETHAQHGWSIELTKPS